MNEATVKLNIDTSEAENKLKAFEQQAQKMGMNIGVGGPADNNDKAADTKQSSDKAADVADEYNKLINGIKDSTQKLIDKLNELSSKQGLNTSAENASPKANPSSTGGSGTTPTAPSSGGSGSGNLPSSTNNAMADFTKRLLSISTVIGAITSTAGYVSNSMGASYQREKLAYNTYAGTGYYAGDYNKARSEATKAGLPYGYNSAETLGMYDTYMSYAGKGTSQANLNTDVDALMKASKAYGLDLGEMGGATGRMSQTGTFQSGDQNKMINILATSIKQANMEGREGEQLQVLESINDTLGKTQVTVSQKSLTESMGLYNALANTSEGWKGSRGAQLVNDINNNVSAGSGDLGLLQMYGYKGSSVQELNQARKELQNGISTSELKTAFGNSKRFGAWSDRESLIYYLSSSKNNVLQTQLSEEQAEKLADAYLNGTLTESSDVLSDLVGDEAGNQSVEKSIQEEYEKSPLKSEEQYASTTQEANDTTGAGANKATSPLKGLYNSLPKGVQQVLNGTGAAVGGAVKWALPTLGGYALMGGIKGMFGGEGLVKGALGAFGIGGKAAGAATAAEAAAGTTVAAGAAEAAGAGTEAGVAAGVAGGAGATGAAVAGTSAAATGAAAAEVGGAAAAGTGAAAGGATVGSMLAGGGLAALTGIGTYLIGTKILKATGAYSALEKQGGNIYDYFHKDEIAQGKANESAINHASMAGRGEYDKDKAISELEDAVKNTKEGAEKKSLEALLSALQKKFGTTESSEISDSAVSKYLSQTNRNDVKQKLDTSVPVSSGTQEFNNTLDKMLSKDVNINDKQTWDGQLKIEVSGKIDGMTDQNQSLITGQIVSNLKQNADKSLTIGTNTPNYALANPLQNLPAPSQLFGTNSLLSTLSTSFKRKTQ